MGLWDNQTKELQDCGTMGHMMGQWDYRAHYGTTLIAGSAAVPLPMGQQDKPQDYGTMGQQNYGKNYGTAHITGSEVVPLPKKTSLCIIDNSQCVYCVTLH